MSTSNCQNTWRYDRRPGKDDNDFENKTEIESMKSVSSDIGEQGRSIAPAGLAQKRETPSSF